MASVQPRSFADLLRRYRVAAGLTQEELAERAGLSRRAIGALESGARRAPRKDTVSLLVKALVLSSAEQALLVSAARQHPPIEGLRASPSGTQAEPSPISLSYPRQPSIPLVGRLRELAALGRHLAGEGPPVLLVAGEPGIGKSRLLREAEEQARAQGWMVLAGGCHLRSRQEPYAPFAGILARFLAGRPPARQRVDLQGCRWLVRLLPELADSSVVPAPTWTLSPEQERRLLFAAVTQFCANVAGPAGTLLLLDDLHWAGEDALELLAALVREPGPQPLRVVAAYRDTEVWPHDPLGTLIADLARTEAGTPPIVLPPLAPDEATELLARLLAEVPEIAQGAVEDLRHIVAPRASGMPLYLISFAQDIRMNPLAAATPDHVPWSAAESIRQRIARLSPAAQEALAIAATAGRQVARTVLLRTMWALNYDEGEALRALEEAARARLLIEAPGERAVFAHDLIQETLVADMSRARQAMLHRRVAEAQETLPLLERRAAELAWHFAESDEPARALPYALQAGDQALAVYAYEEAAQEYRIALSLAEDVGERGHQAEALEHLGRTLVALARYQDALPLLDAGMAAYRSLGNLESVGQVLELIGEVYIGAGPHTEGIARLQADGEALIEAGLSPAGAAALQLKLSTLFQASREVSGMLASAERAVQYAHEAGNAHLVARATWQRSFALRFLGQLDEAIPLAEEAVRRLEAVGDDLRLWSATFNLAAYFQDTGELVQSAAYRQRNKTVAERSSEPTRIARSAIGRAELAFTLGQWARAQDECAWASTLVAPGRTSWGQPEAAYLAIMQGTLWLAQGQDECGIASLTQALTWGERTQDFQLVRFAQAALAERDLVVGQAARARDRIAPLLVDHHGHEEVDVTMCLHVLAWSHLELGEVKDAKRVIEQAAVRAERGHLRLALVDVWRILALVALRQHRWHEATARLEQGLALCRAMPYPYAEAKALYVYGQLHAAMGEPGRARERYTEALAICRRLGERPYAEQIERALALLPG